MSTDSDDETLTGLNGFTLIPDFITVEEEDLLIKQLESNSRIPHRRSERIKKKLKRAPEPWEGVSQKFYGYAGDTRMHKGCIDTRNPIPDYLDDLVIRLEYEVKDIDYNSVVVNDYPPGKGIPHHYDLNSYVEAVVCLSLGSDVDLSFKSFFYNDVEVRRIPRRSLYIIEGEALEKWRHGIDEGQKTDRRYAITFRRCDLEHLNKKDVVEGLPLIGLINF